MPSWASASNVERKPESYSLLCVGLILLLQHIYSLVLCKSFRADQEHSCLQTGSKWNSQTHAAFLQSSLCTPSGMERGERGGWTLAHAQKMPWADPSSSEKVIGLFLLCLTFFVNLGITYDLDSVSPEIFTLTTLCLSADHRTCCSPWKRPLFQVKVVSTF